MRNIKKIIFLIFLVVINISIVNAKETIITYEYDNGTVKSLSNLMDLQEKSFDQRYSGTAKVERIANDERQKATEQITEYIETINGTINSFSINTCAKEDGITTKYSNCEDYISDFKDFIKGKSINVRHYINQSYFTEEDQIIKDYRSAVQKAENLIANSEKEIEEKKKETVKEELGTNNNSISNNNNNNNNEKVNVVDMSICHQEGVKKALKFIGVLLLIAKILVPIILIVFGVMDYAKAMTATDADAISKATKSLIFRFLAGVIIFILPTIVDFVFSTVVKNNAKYNQCRACIFERKC